MPRPCSKSKVSEMPRFVHAEDFATLSARFAEKLVSSREMDNECRASPRPSEGFSTSDQSDETETTEESDRSQEDFEGEQTRGCKRNLHSVSSSTERSEQVRRAYTAASKVLDIHDGQSRLRLMRSSVRQKGLTIRQTVCTTRVLQMDFLESLVKDRSFQLGFCAIILMNAIFIGITTDISVKDSIARHSAVDQSEDSVPWWLLSCETTFNVLFVLELMLRVLALQGEFFVGPDWRWNMTDAVVVMLSLVELGLLAGGYSPIYVRSLYVARVARSLRLLRLVKVTPLVSKLRMLTIALIHCQAMMVWAIVVLLLVIFLFAVIFLNAVSQYISAASPNDPNVEGLEVFFGSIWMTMLTLFMSVAGGVDWWDVVRLLLEIHPVYALVFLMFVIITVIAVMNVINAIFVNDAMENARMDLGLRMQREIAQTKLMVETLTTTFNEMCKWGDTVCLEDFVAHTERQDMKLLCSTLGLQYTDGQSLFKLLDVDGDGEVSIDEFVIGFLRLEGGGTLIELDVMMRETKALVKSAMAEHRNALKRMSNSVAAVVDKLAVLDF